MLNNTLKAKYAENHTKIDTKLINTRTQMQIIWKKLSNSTYADNTSLFTNRPCPICKIDNYKTLLKLDDFQFFSDSSEAKQIDINDVQCKSCGAIYLNPCYSNKGFQILFEEAGQSYGSTDKRPIEQVAWLNKYNLLQDGHTVLDIGCGTGNFLASLPNNILKIGVDIDAPSIKTAQKQHKNIKFICSSFEKLQYTDNINTITMYHVLEHLTNPLETLQQLHELSNDFTKLVIEVPIIENGLTNDINGFFSVQHLTHFSRNSFENILSLSGWEILEWQEQDDYNGCRVLAKKSNISTQLEKSSKVFVNAYTYLGHWYNTLEKIENKIKDITKSRCIIWGGGMHLEFLYQTTSLFTKDIDFIIVDSDKSKQNKSWRGINIYDPSILKDIISDDNFYIPSSYRNQNIFKNEFLKYGAIDENIITLYDEINVY